MNVKIVTIYTKLFWSIKSRVTLGALGVAILVEQVDTGIHSCKHDCTVADKPHQGWVN